MPCESNLQDLYEKNIGERVAARKKIFFEIVWMLLNTIYVK
jgi:hypothetical protein